MSQRATFLRWVLEALRSEVPYIYGGRDVDGFDCSGLVVLGLYIAGGPDCRSGWWTQRMWDAWERIGGSQTRPGDLAFYGSAPDRIEHVMVLLEGGAVVGASGGTRATTTREAALKTGARMKRYSTPTYRADLLGFRRLPLPLD